MTHVVTLLKASHKGKTSKKNDRTVLSLGKGKVDQGG